MKCLKEALSRLANREEQTRGAFFESRFKSVAILDEESLLATCAYIDLNPVAAGIAEVPEASAHTSIKQLGVRLRSAPLKPKGGARRVFFDTRKPTCPICGSCRSLAETPD